MLLKLFLNFQAISNTDCSPENVRVVRIDGWDSIISKGQIFFNNLIYKNDVSLVCKMLFFFFFKENSFQLYYC
jgi:hypothetical protein